jgi:hypothetical protein
MRPALTRLVAAIGTAAIVCAALPASAQHAVIRIKGRVLTERGEPVPDAELRSEAFYGFAAGTFAGQRTFNVRTNAKGEWSFVGLQPGIWLFEVLAPRYVPETVVLPIRILTTVSMGTSGLGLTWDLVLKPQPTPSDERHGAILADALGAARAGQPNEAQALLATVPEDAGRVAMVARRQDLAKALFLRSLERDPSSYRAALGIASIFLWQREFDSASRAFDAARSRTHDKDEQKFLSAAIGDLATIKVR